ncbi:MAG TPA: hypothetical protein VJT71_13585 [Pyrinomonadaceae bacterium]|nr:hypothetical protein [Pyrinomonadaceae bacterium]
MKSTKCSQCGLVYWSTAPNCKRCGLATPDFASDGPAPEPQHESTAAPQPTNSYYAPPPQPAPHISPDKELLHYLKIDTRIFYVIGALQGLLWFIVGDLLIVDAALNIGLAFAAHKFRSRVAAILLMLLTMLSVMMVILSFFEGGKVFSPIAPVILILRLFASGRIVYSTFTLEKYGVVETFVPPPPPPTFHPDGSPQWSPATPANQWQ